MREIAFIKQNKEKWLEVEQTVYNNLHKTPDILSEMYVGVLNDLAFSQTYYPTSQTTRYLNELSARLYQKVYKTKRLEKNRLKYFFATEVPLLMYEYRKVLYFTLSIFCFFVFIGIFSTSYDEGIPRLILGDAYVNETIENIKKGNPIAVYESGSTWGSTIAITFNNLMVGARMYIYGIFLGLGSLLMLLYNSVMLGSFQYFFAEQGKLTESMRGIWMHGVFEIFAMVVEATAGIVLGSSILFPKTYTRLQALKKGAMDSFKIFVATIPFTIFAGFTEGYLTRHALHMPMFLNLMFIFTCLGIVIYYFIIYPYRVFHREKFQKPLTFSKLIIHDIP